MGQTPKLLLPYPEPTDPADGPAGFSGLANAVEAGLVPGFVSALPGAPYDGQVIDYLADATNGVVWRLRYRAAAAGPYRWHYLGGPPLSGRVDTNEPLNAVGFVDLATVGPSVTVPLAGDYLVTVQGNGSANGVCTVSMSYAIGASAANIVDGGQGAIASAGYSLQAGGENRHNGIPAGTVIKAKYQVTAGSGFFRNRWMRVTAVRVG